jgi:hypothetical protein
MTADATGFWSYTHKDDEAEKGRIEQLAHDLVDQYQMITGETIKLFFDRDSLEWGDNWRAIIDENLLTAAFFVAILTPRYFTSAECRRELQTFAREAKRLGISDLVLSITYVDVPGLEADDPQDELMALVKQFQWEDWRELRFADVASSEYRKAVAKMARRLADANRAATAAEIPKAVGAISSAPKGEEGADDEPGLIDILAAGQTGMEALSATSIALSEEMQAFNAFTQNAAADIKHSDNEGRGPVGRLAIAKELAKNLTGPANRFLESASKYASQLYDADASTRTLIALAAGEIEENLDSKAIVCEFFKVTTTTASIAQSLGETLEGFSQSITQVEKLSRDLRPPLQTMKHGIAIVMEASSLATGWLQAIEESPVDCASQENG